LNGTFIVGRDFATNAGNAGVQTYRIQFGYKFEYQTVFNPPKSEIGVGERCVDSFRNAYDPI
jgi:hypothetical protein